MRGNFDQALEIVRELARRHPVELVNSINPYRIEGQKTAAFEACDELGGPPDALAIPVGNAGNITAWWQGFQEYGASPVLYGFQAEGAAPLVHGKPVAEPETIASAIRIGNPARWEEAMDAVTGSRGRIAAVSDEQILDAYRLLASREGVFCEPASAASVAGILAHGLPASEDGEPPSSVLCVLTGHGLKDPDTALGKAPGVIGLRGGGRGGGARRLRLAARATHIGVRFVAVCAPRARGRGRRSSPMLAELLGLVVPPRCALCAQECGLRRAALRAMRVRAACGSRRARRRFRDWTPPGRPRPTRASPGIWWWRSSSVRGCRWPGARAREIAERAPAGLLEGVIVPVPPAPVRRRWRGFDAAETIATALSVEAGLPLRACLRRSQGRRQVGRPRRERLAAPPRVRLAGPPPGAAVLVDDVVTTGATLGACARALRSGGCGRVVALTFARSGHPATQSRMPA